jgi:pyridoxal phosphate-dependent aminotransferase EpsN
VGRAQLRCLSERVEARRANFEFYRTALDGLPGLGFMAEAPYGRSSRWLTCITIEPESLGCGPEQLRLALEAENIEARPVWKPLHLQPAFAGDPVVGGAVAERLFQQGLCLPSGSALLVKDLARVADVITRAATGGGEGRHLPAAVAGAATC